MDRDKLESRRAMIEKEFDAAVAQKDELDKEIFRFQGDYRTINSLLNDLVSVTESKPINKVEKEAIKNAKIRKVRKPRS